MRILQTFLLICVSILVSFGNLYSQSIEISVQDTVIDRGGNNIVWLWHKTNNSQIKTLYSEYIFNANVIDIKEFFFEVDHPFIKSGIVDIDMADINNAILKITIEFTDSIPYGSIGHGIFVEGLAGADTVTMITPVKAIVDGVEISETYFKAGKITVRSSAVIPGIAEGLGQNRPNPFSDWTTFPFGLNKDSEISFAVYGMGGRKILDDDNITEIFDIQIQNDSGEVFNEYKGKVLKRGNYSLSLRPNSWDLSSGTYFILMKTASGVYKNNFMYVK